MTLKYESELLFDLMKRDGDDTPSDVLPYESELKEKYLNQVVGAYPKLQDYRPEWLNYNLYHHIPSAFPVESVTNVTSASFHNVVPYAYESAILMGNTDYKSVDWITNFHYQHGVEFTNGKVGYIERDVRCSTCVDINENRRFILKASSNIDISIVTADENNNVIKDYLWFVTTADETRFTVEDNCKFLYLNFRKKDLSAFTSESEVINSGLTVKEQNLVSVKMPVLTTTGKNLFDENRRYESSHKLWFAIPFEKDSYFTFSSFDTIPYIEFYGTTTEFIDKLYGGDGVSWKPLAAFSNEESGTFKKGSKYNYVIIAFDKVNLSNGEDFLKNLQVEQGTQATPYEPFKSNILTVNEEVELRGIGVVQDTLDCLTGEKVERIGEIVLDGSENWVTLAGGRFSISKFLRNVKRPALSVVNIMCDGIKPISYLKEVDGEKGICLFNETIYDFIVRTEFGTVNEFKQYLSQNPVTIQYQLATESIKTVDLTVTDQDGNTESNIRPIEGTMHVNTSSQTLSPLLDMSVPVEATTQNLASFANIEEEE